MKENNKSRSPPRKHTPDKPLVPFRISFDGVIARSIARLLNSLCDLFEEFNNWLIRKLK